MKRFKIIITLCLLIITLFHLPSFAYEGSAPAREYYELKVYHFANEQQANKLDHYLQFAFLPFLHRNGINKAGVFTWTANDTSADKRIYVLIPHKSLESIEKLQNLMDQDKKLDEEGKEYLQSNFDQPPYTRYETIVLKAFEKMPLLDVPHLTGPKSNRIYELRSYEGATEKYYRNKLKMFNQGDEVKLFKRLGFNAVFYAEVISGCRMPNLMYMTTFEDKASREEHWKTFGSDPEWKNLSGLPEYQHNVSKADILFLVPTEYSDL